MARHPADIPISRDLATAVSSHLFAAIDQLAALGVDPATGLPRLPKLSQERIELAADLMLDAAMSDGWMSRWDAFSVLSTIEDEAMIFVEQSFLEQRQSGAELFEELTADVSELQQLLGDYP